MSKLAKKNCHRRERNNKKLFRHFQMHQTLFRQFFFSYFFTKKMEVTVVFLYFLSQRFSRHFQTFLDTISRVIRLFQIKFRNIQTALDRLLCILDIFRCIQILQIELQPVTPFILRLLFLQLFFKGISLCLFHQTFQTHFRYFQTAIFDIIRNIQTFLDLLDIFRYIQKLLDIYFMFYPFLYFFIFFCSR